MSSALYSLAQPPTIASLLDKHKDAVEAVLASAKEFVDKTPFVKQAAADAPLDDVFVLRHVLSAPKHSIKDATANVIKTLEWRAANADDLKAAREGKPIHDEVFSQYVQKGYIGELGGMHPLFIVRVGYAKTSSVVKALTHEQMVQFFLTANEFTFSIADRNTRKLGVLCKCVTALDFAGLSFFNFNRKYGQAAGDSSHLSSVYYPQLVGKTAMLNTGSAFKMLMSLARVVLSPTVLNKQGVCGRSGSNKDPRDCPFLAQFAKGSGKVHGAEIIPKYLGGPVPTLPSLARPEDADQPLREDAAASGADS